MLDTAYEVAVPEFVVFRYRIAGPTPRFFAVAIDHIMIAGGLLAVIILISVLGQSGLLAGKDAAGVATFFFFIAFFLLYWFYFFFFEWLNRGRTPGKMLMGLRVVSADGTALDVLQVVIRSLLRVADMFPMIFLGWLFFLPSYATGFIAILSTTGFQRLGDMAAGTLVVREGTERAHVELIKDERIASLADRLNVRVTPSPGFVQAVSDFAAARSRLTPERRLEIALSVEARVRHYFSAEHLACTPVELILAVHHFYFILPLDKTTGRVGAPTANGFARSQA